MTAPRRSLLFLAAAAFLFPACISINAKSTPLTPPDVAAQMNAQTVAFAGVHGAASATHSVRKSDFAIFPAPPGETVARSATKDTNVAQKQPPVGNAGVTMPVAPPPPDGVITAVHPAPFPLAPVRANVLTEPPLLAAVRAYVEG